MNEQLLKTSDADVLSSKRKLSKTLGGWHPPPLIHVRGLKLSTHLLSYEVVALHALHNNKPNLFPLDP